MEWENPSIAKPRARRTPCPCCNCKLHRLDGSKGLVSEHICPFGNCRKIYGKVSHLTAHLRSHYNDRPFVCDWPDCDRRFTRSDDFQRHKRTHTGEKNYKCPYCSKTFTRRDHMTKHANTHTGNSKRTKRIKADNSPSKCMNHFEQVKNNVDECNSSVYEQKEGVEATSIAKTSSKNKLLKSNRPYKCDWLNCLQAFKRSDDLLRHKRTHTGIKNFKCFACEKKFARKDHLTKHERIHDSFEKTTSCKNLENISDSQHSIKIEDVVRNPHLEQEFTGHMVDEFNCDVKDEFMEEED